MKEVFFMGSGKHKTVIDQNKTSEEVPE